MRERTPPGLSEAEFHHRAMSFSWEGEDIVVTKLFADTLGVRIGFFIDVGAHHPVAYSNTYALYKQGWRGINIDPHPGSMNLFREWRPADRNIETGIARERGMLRFSMFENSCLNGFLTDDEIETHRKFGHMLVEQRAIECMPLTEVLEREQVTRKIDLLNVDVEGRDIEIYQSLDFRRYRPRVIIAEIIGTSDIRSVYNTDICRFLEAQGYVLFSRMIYSVIFLDGFLAERINDLERPPSSVY
jgi:FkbM family methyltransferase